MISKNGYQSLRAFPHLESCLQPSLSAVGDREIFLKPSGIILSFFEFRASRRPGPIPPELGSLTALSRVEFDGNQRLSGESLRNTRLVVFPHQISDSLSLIVFCYHQATFYNCPPRLYALVGRIFLESQARSRFVDILFAVTKHFLLRLFPAPSVGGTHVRS